MPRAAAPYAPHVLSALILLAPAAVAAQELVDVPLDCEPAPAGAACTVEGEVEGTLYCVAYGEDEAPVANSTVSSDAGLAAFNVVPEDIASIRCRVE